jgi:hypothetical protein
MVTIPLFLQTLPAIFFLKVAIYFIRQSGDYIYGPRQTCLSSKLAQPNPQEVKLKFYPWRNLCLTETVVHHRSPPPQPRKRQKKRQTSAIPKSERAPSHTKMLSEPMKRTVASDETETLWHVGWGYSPWSPDPDVVNFIQRSRRRGTSPPFVVHTPNYKTPNKPTAADVTATRESAERQPPHTNLTGETTGPPAPRRYR